MLNILRSIFAASHRFCISIFICIEVFSEFLVDFFSDPLGLPGCSVSMSMFFPVFLFVTDF